jgi:nucleoside 2-deoxyribosyltransferase
MAMLIYLAGPEVFLAEATAIGARKKAICATYEFEGVYPFDEPLPTGITTDVGHRIFDNCVAMMDRCDLVVANMTPWRGISMDVGTAVEVGYMYAQGKPVFGYTNVATDYATRCEDDGGEIEAFGFHDNLMCEGPVFLSGGHVVRRDVAPDSRYTDLEAFEACVRQARERVDA